MHGGGDDHQVNVIQTTWETVEAAMRPLVQTDEGATEVASAFYDVAWVPVDSPARTYAEAMDIAYSGEPHGVLVHSWKNTGAFVAEMRGKHESYLDVMWDAQSEVVSERVERVMLSLGLRPVV